MAARPEGKELLQLRPPGAQRRTTILHEALRVAAVATLLLLLVFLLRGGGEPLPQGRPAPLTQGLTLDGGAFDLRTWQGQYVFVNVWATWCAPCLQELPDLAAASKRWPQVRFVGLAADSKRADVDVVTSRLGLPYPVLLIDGALQHAWNASALPSSFLVAPDGTIAWSGVGALDARSLDEVLRKSQSATTRP